MMRGCANGPETGTEEISYGYAKPMEGVYPQHTVLAMSVITTTRCFSTNTDARRARAAGASTAERGCQEGRGHSRQGLVRRRRLLRRFIASGRPFIADPFAGRKGAQRSSRNRSYERAGERCKQSDENSGEQVSCRFCHRASPWTLPEMELGAKESGALYRMERETVCATLNTRGPRTAAKHLALNY